MRHVRAHFAVAGSKAITPSQEVGSPLRHDVPVDAAAAADDDDEGVEGGERRALPLRVQQRQRRAASGLDEHAVVVEQRRARAHRLRVGDQFGQRGVAARALEGGVRGLQRAEARGDLVRVRVRVRVRVS